MGVGLGKTGVSAARDSGSSAAKLKLGQYFQEPLTEVAILHWKGKSSTCLHEGLWSYSMVLAWFLLFQNLSRNEEFKPKEKPSPITCNTVFELSEARYSLHPSSSSNFIWNWQINWLSPVSWSVLSVLLPHVKWNLCFLANQQRQLSKIATEVHRVTLNYYFTWWTFPNGVLWV